MSPDTLSLFGLSAEPFSKEIDGADLCLPPSKQGRWSTTGSTQPRHERESRSPESEGSGKPAWSGPSACTPQGAVPADLLPQRHPPTA